MILEPRTQPNIAVGIMDRQTKVHGGLNGDFHGDGFRIGSGGFSAKATAETIILTDEAHREIARSPSFRFTPLKDSTFTLYGVTIGTRFHWERTEDQTFWGDLILRLRKDGTITVINEISLEDYLMSVISSEMNPDAPTEFLKAHAVLSRSWLLAALGRKGRAHEAACPAGRINERQGEVMRWYDREDHDLFDVCGDDHCQRYQGITKIVSAQAQDAARETCGRVITFQDEICDARYSKACGGITEEFGTAWEDKQLPYLGSVSDAPISHLPIGTEQEASKWILSNPEAYCNTRDERLLETILPDSDRETKAFFRWRVEYLRTELEDILREKSALDLGTLQDIIPLHSGPSGRISRLKIVGSKSSVVVGKELEIRRWFSRSHLQSSAFFVTFEAGRVIFHGAGWGHGVGLCQIGAAVMATRGFSAEDILRHYFSDIEVQKLY